MPILIILIVVGLVLFLQRWVYTKFWDRHLDAEVTLRDYYMVEGEETELTEVVKNAKWLPLPWVQLKFEIMRNGTTDNLFRSDLFNILFHQRITRKSKLKLTKRGVYEINKLDLLSYDMFISRKLYTDRAANAKITVFPRTVGREVIQIPFEKLIGSIATRRYTLEDPFLFKGIRDYQPGDRFRDINFNATAKAGHFLVNTHEYTLDQKVKVVLLTDKAGNYYDENEYEMGLRYAAELILSLEEAGIPASFMSNGLDSLEGREVAVEAGCSQNHVDTILEAMARLDVAKTGTPGVDVLAALAEASEPDEHTVVVCPDRSKAMLSEYQNLHDRTEAAMFISPAAARSFFDMTEWEKSLEDTMEDFYFYKV